MSRREFSAKVKLAAWDRCGGRCEGEVCGVRLTPGRFAYDHVIADALGGAPTVENCSVLCNVCHGIKTAGHDVPTIAKTVRLRKRVAGIRKPSTLPGGRDSNTRIKMNGQVVDRRTGLPLNSARTR